MPALDTGLVRSSQNIRRCPLYSNHADVTVNVYIHVGKRQILLVCVQNVLHVVEYKLDTIRYDTVDLRALKS